MNLLIKVLKILKQHHIPFDGIVSELFEPDDDFDYIIAMDQSNVDNIKSINPNLKGQLFKLLEFSNMEETDVPDPITQIILKVYMTWYNHLVTI